MKKTFPKGYDGRRGKGGARPGAGRKPNPETILRRLALADLDTEVERSLAFMVDVRDDPAAGFAVRLEAAKEIMNRRLGRPRQAVSVTGEANEPPVIVVTNYGCDCKKNVGAKNPATDGVGNA